MSLASAPSSDEDVPPPGTQFSPLPSGVHFAYLPIEQLEDDVIELLRASSYDRYWWIFGHELHRQPAPSEWFDENQVTIVIVEITELPPLDDDLNGSPKDLEIIKARRAKVPRWLLKRKIYSEVCRLIREVYGGRYP